MTPPFPDTPAVRAMRDWLLHAQGCRRRAWEYKRWALEYEADGNLTRYRQYREQSDRSWRMAKRALADAKLQRRLAS